MRVVRDRLKNFYRNNNQLYCYYCIPHKVCDRGPAICEPKPVSESSVSKPTSEVDMEEWMLGEDVDVYHEDVKRSPVRKTTPVMKGMCALDYL